MTDGDIVQIEDQGGAQTLRLPGSLRLSRRSGDGLVIEPLAQTEAEIDL